jgi:phage terminase large subunit-like protein
MAGSDFSELDCSKLKREQANELYREILSLDDDDAERWLCRNDLFFLLSVACKRRDVNKDWLYDRCWEVQSEPNGYLDLWAREHYKSTIITFAKSIQDILANPEVTIGIFSHTRPIAKGFLGQIKQELEQNVYLKSLFPDVLYAEPQRESPKWGLDVGIRVKRKGNPKEETVEAWGLVDGQPTAKHFGVCVYDDVVTLESVSTPDQIKKVNAALELSYNLGAQGGKRRFIGTRYHLNDSYRTIMDRGTAEKRVKPATDTGKMDGNSVLMPQELLLEKRRDMGPYTFDCQMLQNPVADRSMSFRPEWVRYYETLGDTSKWNKYILVDPASAKKATSDYTVMMVLGLAPDQNFYLLSAIRDRLNLTQRGNKLFDLHREFKPTAVGYERYGMQADIEHVRYVQEQKNYRFEITELGGTMAKEDRIKMLVPKFEQGRLWLPKRMAFIDHENRTQDFIKIFLENEYLAFPVCIHDDMLDCLARILDPVLGAKFPKEQTPKAKTPGYLVGGSESWMG